MIVTVEDLYNLFLEINGANKYENEKSTVLFQGLINQKCSIKAKLLLSKLSDYILEDYKELLDKRNELNDEQFKEYLKEERELDVRYLWGNDLKAENFDIVTNEVYRTFYKILND